MEQKISSDFLESVKRIQKAHTIDLGLSGTSAIIDAVSQSLRNVYDMKSLDDTLEPLRRSFSQNLPKPVLRESLAVNEQLQQLKEAFRDIDTKYAVSSFTQAIEEHRIKLQALYQVLQQHSSSQADVPHQPLEVEVPDQFYEVAEPLLPLVECADTQQSPVVSTAKEVVQQRQKTMTLDLLISIISVLVTVILFVLSQLSSEEALQQQLAQAQETNRLLEAQLDAQQQQLAMLQSLDENLQYLIDLQQTVCEQAGADAEGGDPAPKLPVNQQVNDLVGNQPK